MTSKEPIFLLSEAKERLDQCLRDITRIQLPGPNGSELLRAMSHWDVDRFKKARREALCDLAVEHGADIERHESAIKCDQDGNQAVEAGIKTTGSKRIDNSEVCSLTTDTATGKARLDMGRLVIGLPFLVRVKFWHDVAADRASHRWTRWFVASMLNPRTLHEINSNIAGVAAKNGWGD